MESQVPGTRTMYEFTHHSMQLSSLNATFCIYGYFLLWFLEARLFNSIQNAYLLKKVKNLFENLGVLSEKFFYIL